MRGDGEHKTDQLEPLSYTHRLNMHVSVTLSSTRLQVLEHPQVGCVSATLPRNTLILKNKDLDVLPQIPSVSQETLSVRALRPREKMSGAG